MSVSEPTSEDTHSIAAGLRASALPKLPREERVEALVGLARKLLELAQHGNIDALSTSSGLSPEMTRWALRCAKAGAWARRRCPACATMSPPRACWNCPARRRGARGPSDALRRFLAVRAGAMAIPDRRCL